MKQFEDLIMDQTVQYISLYIKINAPAARRFLVVQAAWNATISDNRARQAGGSIVQEYAY